MVPQGKRMRDVMIVKSGQCVVSRVFDKSTSINICTLSFGSILNGDTIMRRSERCQVSSSSKSKVVVWSIRCDFVSDRFLGRNGTLSTIRKQIRSKTTWRSREIRKARTKWLASKEKNRKEKHVDEKTSDSDKQKTLKTMAKLYGLEQELKSNIESNVQRKQ